MVNGAPRVGPCPADSLPSGHAKVAGVSLYPSSSPVRLVERDGLWSVLSGPGGRSVLHAWSEAALGSCWPPCSCPAGGRGGGGAAASAAKAGAGMALAQRGGRFFLFSVTRKKRHRATRRGRPRTLTRTSPTRCSPLHAQRLRPPLKLTVQVQMCLRAARAIPNGVGRSSYTEP